MKFRSVLLSLAAVCSPLANASAQRSTAPVGYLSYSLSATTTATTTFLSAPLAPASRYVGIVASAGANTINVTGTAWTENRFVQQPCHVLMISGAEAGRTLGILGNAATQLTVDVTDGDTQATTLDTAGFMVIAGDRFEIIANDTLGSFFGAAADTAVLTGGANAAAADQVGLWNETSGVFEVYYFNTSMGHWVKDGDAAMSDAAGLVLAPGAAMAVVRQPNRPARRMVLTGVPPTVAPLLKMAGNEILQYYGAPFPVDITLSQLDLATNWRKKHSLAKADTLFVYQAARAKWRPYHEQKNGLWLRGSHEGIKNGLAIPAGSVLGFLKHQPVSGSDAFVRIALPYSP